MYGDAYTCAEGERLGHYDPWFSLFCFLVVKLGALETTSVKSFSILTLRRIMGYPWDYAVSNNRVLRETWMSQVTCMIRQYRFQYRLAGYLG